MPATFAASATVTLFLCILTWNKLADQPWLIMSIGLRQWAHGF